MGGRGLLRSKSQSNLKREKAGSEMVLPFFVYFGNYQIQNQLATAAL
jgi:hypothetical protein